MNTELIKYGIHQYNSEYCIHVGFRVGALFVYKTSEMQKLVSNKSYRTAPAFQEGIKTANGFLVPCREAIITTIEFLPFNNKYNRDADETIKGEWALEIVWDAIKQGKLSFLLTPGKVTDKSLQIKGKDIMIVGPESLQVKCDWEAGPKEKGGTGNLYIQTHECNPLRKH